MTILNVREEDSVDRQIKKSTGKRIGESIGMLGSISSIFRRKEPDYITSSKIPDTGMASMTQYLTLGALILGGIGLLWYISQQKEVKGK